VGKRNIFCKSGVCGAQTYKLLVARHRLTSQLQVLMRMKWQGQYLKKRSKLFIPTLSSKKFGAVVNFSREREEV